MGAGRAEVVVTAAVQHGRAARREPSGAPFPTALDGDRRQQGRWRHDRLGVALRARCGVPRRAQAYGIAWVLVGLLSVIACGGPAAPVPTSTPTSIAPMTPTASSPPTVQLPSTEPPSLTESPTETNGGPIDAPSTATGLGPEGVEITLPPPGVEATGPVVVLVHGGAWVAGGPDLMSDWADAIAAAGSVVYNASYRLAGQPGGGYPGTVDDVACAVRFARATAADHTRSTDLVIMGHSAGGHLAAVVALNQDAFGGSCAYPPADPPDQLVALAGIYDVRGLGLLFHGWMGGSPTERPQAWRAANPVELAGLRDDLDVVLVTGADDEVVRPEEATAFAALLDPARLTREVVAAADHTSLQSPSVVGLAALHLDR